MKTIIALTATAAALATATAAQAQDPAYSEPNNWLQAWGQTQKDFGDPDETSATVVNSANNAVVNLQDPDAAKQGPYQLHTWPWSGDPDREAWTGRKIVLSIPCDGIKLAATVWGAKTNELATGGRTPGVVINEGFQGVQPMYYWAAQGLADAGYQVLTFDTPGQGDSENGSCANTLGKVVDFFMSDANPLRAELDADRVGTAGHSAGAGAVSTLGDDNGKVKAISAWSDLGAGYTGKAPIQGQGADYDAWIAPPPYDTAGTTESDSKLTGFNAVKARGIDTQEIVIESGTHLAWSHVTWSYTAVWSEEVALHYALAWFDRYLAHDYKRDGKKATERLKENYAAHEFDDAYGVPGSDEGHHGLSRKFHSAYFLDGVACGDQRKGC